MDNQVTAQPDYTEQQEETSIHTQVWSFVQWCHTIAGTLKNIIHLTQNQIREVGKGSESLSQRDKPGIEALRLF